MHEHVTLLRPDEPSSGRRSSSELPRDLLEQVRSRLSLLALLLLVPFAFYALLFFGTRIVAAAFGYSVQTGSFARLGFMAVNLGAVAASAAIWWVARNRRVTASRLLVLGLAYEVVICFVIALIFFWQHYLDKGFLPPLTWVPVVVILFPLILPGPPRRMLVSAIATGAMAPIALLVLDLSGTVPVEGTRTTAQRSPRRSRWDSPTWGREPSTGSGGR